MTKHYLISTIILLPVLCGAQTAPQKSNSPAPVKQAQPAVNKDADSQAKQNVGLSNPPAAPSVGAEETVITIHGVCPANTPAENCSTKLTRGEFERLISAVNPNLPIEARRSVATSYAQLLVMANQAQKMGVDKDPNVQVQMHIQGLSLLAQALQRKLLEAGKPTAQEVESYYTENSGKYEEISLRRIVVMKSAGTDVKPEQLKQLADQIRSRAAAGEDPDKLQVEAYKAAKSTGVPPSTDLGWKRHGGMDPRHEPQILPLHASEVSPVLEDAQAFYIYKVDSKRLIPLATVEKEIGNTLQTERAQKTFKEMMEGSKPQLNEAYFGPAQPKAPSLQSPPPK